jgi:biotin-(acetyl-CoA carboxylase) ligase
LKAPNDLFLDRLKLAGILIESVSQGSNTKTVVGIGLNVCKTPSDIATATALADQAMVSQEKWTAFLNRLFNGLSSAMIEGQRSELSSEKMLKLQHALNQNPNLSEPILKVDSHAGLYSASRTWHWYDL